MIPKFLLIAPLALALAAPLKAAPSINDSALPQAAEQTGVQLTPITRNETPSQVSFALAKDGVAVAPIVISEKASATTKLAAEDLRKYLSQMSGAEFQIETGDGQSGIAVGTMAEFPVPALGKALEIYHEIDGKEAYAIRTREKRVLLLGATDLGTSHAVYRFLEELGCRWFFPNSTGNWEVIPKVTDLKFAKDITDRPTFLYRGIWAGYGIFNDAGHPDSTPENPRSGSSDFADWARRNAQGKSFVVEAGHNLFNVVTPNRAEFEAHPEYFALSGGKRTGGPQLELGNPKVRALILDWARDYFIKNPGADMLSLDPADGGGESESDETKAYAGNASNAQFKMANEVAKMLQKEFPGKMVGMYAYNWHSDPPPFALEPNVYIQLTMGFNAGKLTLDELFEQWPKKARNLGFYDYYSVWRWDSDMWPGGRIANKNYAPQRIRLFQKLNAESKAFATSISAESSNNWGVNGRGYYLASKMMWNPQLDAGAITEDFYEKAFGPAAPAMKNYYDLQDNVPPASPGVTGAIFRRFKAARDAARGDEAVMKRLDDIGAYLRYYDLGKRPGADEARALAIKTLMYRNRYSYMNHYEAFRQDVIREDYNPTAPTPWKVDEPITRSEVDNWVDEAIAFYPELNIPPQTQFSNKVVPVNLGGDPKKFGGPRYQAGSPKWVFYSIKGEPIRATLISLNQYGGEKLSYELRAEDGKLLAEGKPIGTAEGTRTELNVKVPAPGRYYLTYTDGSGSMYGLEVPAGQPFAFDMATIEGSTLGGDTPDLYFYVPKGVKTIEYYFTRTDYSNSGPHMVVDPNGVTQAKFNVLGDYLSVPVPEGLDGKAWRFTGDPNAGPMGLGRFHFFNCPDFLSPSSAQLLVPREVAEKDGLQIIR